MVATISWLAESVKSYFYPTTTTPVVEEKSSTGSLKHAWTVALGDQAQYAKFDDLLSHWKPKHGFTFDSLSLIPNTDQELFSGINRDQGDVVEAENRKLFATHLGSEIVIQMRASTTDGAVSHLGLVLVASVNGVKVFKDKLVEILDLSKGTVEIFIGAGRSSSDKNYQAIHSFIEAVQKKHRNRIVLQDDCFSVIDLGTLSFQKGLKTYQGKVEVSTAGFDEENNPFLVPNVRWNGYRGNIQGGEVYSSLGSNHRIKV